MTVGELKGKEAEGRALRSEAELVCIAAPTAPDGKGEDSLVTPIVAGEMRDRLTAHVRATAVTEGDQSFGVDAGSL